MFKKNLNQNNKNHYDVVIIGAGIAGLNAAVEAQAKGLSVLVIEKRDIEEQDYAVRPQQIVLSTKEVSEDIMHKIQSHQNKKYPDTVKGNHKYKNYRRVKHGETGSGVVAVKTVQRALKDQFDIVNGKNNNQHNAIKFNCQPSKIDLKNGKISVNNNNGKIEEYTFTCLVGADGQKGNSDQLINETSTNKVKSIEDKKVSHPHKQHISAYVRITTDDGTPLSIPDSRAVFGLTGDSYKYALLFKPQRDQDKKPLDCSFSGELPFDVDPKNPLLKKEEVRKYIEETVRNYYKTSGLASKNKIDVNKIKVAFVPETVHHKKTKKEVLKYQPFQLDKIKRTDKSVYSSNDSNDNTHYYFPIGDKRQDPIYQVGTGAENAIQDGNALSDHIFNKDKEPSMEEYTKNVENRRQESRDRLRLLYQAAPTPKPNGWWHLNNTTGKILNKFAPINTVASNQINKTAVYNNETGVTITGNNNNNDIHLLNERTKYRDYKLKHYHPRKKNKIRGDVHKRLSDACNAFLKNQKYRAPLNGGMRILAAGIGVGLLYNLLRSNKINHKVASGLIGGIGALNFAQTGARDINDVRQANKILNHLKNKKENNRDLMKILHWAMMTSNNSEDSLAAYILREFDGTGNTDSKKIEAWKREGNISQKKQQFMSILDSLRSRSVKAQGLYQDKSGKKGNSNFKYFDKKSEIPSSNNNNKLNDHKNDNQINNSNQIK